MCEILATFLNECIKVGDVSGRLVKGRTILVMKDSKKGTEVWNSRAIACLNLIQKLLTGIISDKAYDHLEENKLLPEEQSLRYGPPHMNHNYNGNHKLSK